MTDLVSDSPSTQSPKRKFSFKFPHLSHQSSDKDASSSGHHKSANANRPRNFCEEIQNVPDLQVSFVIF